MKSRDRREEGLLARPGGEGEEEVDDSREAE
jgi:hypothetical protein